MKKGQTLGEGTYGIVYDATSPRTGRGVAVKRNLKEVEVSFVSAVRELNLLALLRDHINVIRTEYVSFGNPFNNTGMLSPLKGKDRKCQIDDSVHFVFEKAGSDFHQVIYTQKPSYSELKRYMAHFLLGLEYIHSHHIIHRDIKPGNLLLFPQEADCGGNLGVLKICDFGLAKPYTQQGCQTPKMVTAWYRAPEISTGNPKYDFKIDTWSAGCTFFEMVARSPFIRVSTAGNEENAVLSAIIAHLPRALSQEEIDKVVASKWRKIQLRPSSKRKKTYTFIKHFGLKPEEIARFEEEAGSFSLFCDLVSRLLEFYPERRLSASQALEHPFFADYSELIGASREAFPPCERLRLTLPDGLSVTLLPGEQRLRVIRCRERTWALKTAFGIYNTNDKLPWYKHRALFQALDLFDRYLLAMSQAEEERVRSPAKSPVADSELGSPAPAQKISSEEQGLFHTRQEAELRFLVCLYVATKYFTSIFDPVSYDTLASEACRTQEAKLEAEEFELGLVKNCLEFEIYRPTVYEALDNFFPPSGPLEEEERVRDLLAIYGKREKAYEDLYPSEIVSKYSRQGVEGFK